MNRGLFLILSAALLSSSCERSIDTPADADFSAPYLHDLQVIPGTFNTDTMLVGGGTDPDDILTIAFTCFVFVDDASGHSGASVRYSVTLPAEGETYGAGALNDNGVAPDLSEGDSIYSGTVTFEIRRVDLGRFEIAVDGYYDPASPSNIVRQGIEVVRSSRAPEISALNAPDSVTLPGPGQVALLLMTVAAEDSDGVGDIREVFFRNLDSPSDTTRKFIMLDDGHITGTSGDSTANDGTFSIIVQLPAATPTGTYRFRFEAIDRSGLSSNTILHPLTVLPPE